MFENMDLCPSCLSGLDGGQEVCARCGFVLASDYDKGYLPPGSTVGKGRYFVGRLARKNGEGATYLGYDYKNGEACWIREYFPTTLARRDANTGTVYTLEGAEAQYKALISDFVDVCNEVKRLGVTERVIPIHDVTTSFNTVYAIYEKKDVKSFDHYLQQHGGKLTIPQARELLLPFCGMVSSIHDRGYIHRGISPYTVFVDNDDNLYLWDFSLGATRTANSELQAELFNGFSAPEQYASNGWQGAWTDVYAIAALFYRAVSGFVPPKSTLIGDDRPLATLDDLVMDVPRNISEAVEDAMAVNAETRTQTVHAFVAHMLEAASDFGSTAVYDTNQTRRTPREPEYTPRRRDGSFKYAFLALVLTVGVLCGGLWYIMKTYLPNMIGPDSSSPVSHALSLDGGEPSPIEPESPSESESSAEIPKVPDFLGKTRTAVAADAEYNDLFEFKWEEIEDEDAPEGTIIKQSPDPDTPMPNRGTVILTVSKGPPLLTMPDVVGLPWKEAAAILDEAKIPYKFAERYAEGADPNAVVSTSPAPGESIAPNNQTATVFVMPLESKSSSSSRSGSSASSSTSSSRRQSSASD